MNFCIYSTQINVLHIKIDSKELSDRLFIKFKTYMGLDILMLKQNTWDILNQKKRIATKISYHLYRLSSYTRQYIYSDSSQVSLLLFVINRMKWVSFDSTPVTAHSIIRQRPGDDRCLRNVQIINATLILH